MQLRDGAEVADLTGLPDLGDRCPDDTMFVVRRERPHPGADLDLVDTVEGVHYQLIATDSPAGTGPLPWLDARHRAHTRVADCSWNARTPQHEASAGRWQTDAMTDDDGYGHLLPLVQALMEAGNWLLPDHRTTAAFQPSQGGYYCSMSGPLRFDAIRDLPRRPEVHLDEANDNIFCTHCWTSIYGARHQTDFIHKS